MLVFVGSGPGLGPAASEDVGRGAEGIRTVAVRAPLPRRKGIPFLDMYSSAAVPRTTPAAAPMGPPAKLPSIAPITAPASFMSVLPSRKLLRTDRDNRHNVYFADYHTFPATALPEPGQETDSLPGTSVVSSLFIPAGTVGHRLASSSATSLTLLPVVSILIVFSC